jgi:hypothetical protein
MLRHRRPPIQTKNPNEPWTPRATALYTCAALRQELQPGRAATAQILGGYNSSACPCGSLGHRHHAPAGWATAAAASLSSVPLPVPPPRCGCRAWCDYGVPVYRLLVLPGRAAAGGPATASACTTGQGLPRGWCRAAQHASSLRLAAGCRTGLALCTTHAARPAGSIAHGGGARWWGHCWPVQRSVWQLWRLPSHARSRQERLVHDARGLRWP